MTPKLSVGEIDHVVADQVSTAVILGVRGDALYDIGALRNLLIVKKSGKTLVDNLPA